jgi:hypothetical protein
MEQEQAVGREPPFRDDLSTEADEYPLLEAVTRKRLVKILRPGRDSACAGVIGKEWKSAMAL